MAISGKKQDRKWRRGELTIFIVSLLLAIFIWLAHNLTQDYFSYRQFRVSVVTSLPGFAPSSEAEEIVSLGGMAKGFDLIRKRRSTAANARTLTLRVDPKYFVADSLLENTFYLNLKDVKNVLDNAVGDDFRLTQVQDQRLRFFFVPQSCRKVPVVMTANRISYEPQYMLSGDITISPDSVLVYGDSDALDAVKQVEAAPIHLQNLKNTTRGRLKLKNVPGMRLGDSIITYTVPVDRYVEQTVTANIQITGIPAGYNVITLPSHIDVVCRVPFGAGSKMTGDDVTFEIGYDEIASSITSKFIPRMTSSTVAIYSYETVPKVVDCIITEVR